MVSQASHVLIQRCTKLEEELEALSMAVLRSSTQSKITDPALIWQAWQCACEADRASLPEASRRVAAWVLGVKVGDVRLMGVEGEQATDGDFVVDLTASDVEGLMRVTSYTEATTQISSAQEEAELDGEHSKHHHIGPKDEEE